MTNKEKKLYYKRHIMWAESLKAGSDWHFSEAERYKPDPDDDDEDDNGTADEETGGGSGGGTPPPKIPPNP